MGSVISEVECPKCKYKFAFNECYYKNGEEYTFCHKCGFSEVIKGYGKSVKRSGGIGAYKVLFNHGGTTGSFDKIKQITEFEKSFKKQKGFTNQSGEKADEVYYTFKKKGKWFIKDLINNKEYEYERKEILGELENA